MLSEKEQHQIELWKISKSVFNFLPYVKIQEPGALALDYVLWKHLVNFYDMLDTHKLIDLLKSKQIGISWALAVRALRRIMIRPGANVLMISEGEEKAKKLLEKARIIYNNLPDWLKEIPEYKVEPNSTTQFGFKGMRSLITALPSTETAGIGETSDWVIHDEADFHDYFEINLGHTLATVADSPLRELTVVSTVDKGKPDSPFKNLYKGALEGRNSFYPLFYPYNARPDRDEAFLEEMKRQNEGALWKVEANYPVSIEEALSPQSAQSCFKKEVLDSLWENAS